MGIDSSILSPRYVRPVVWHNKSGSTMTITILLHALQYFVNELGAILCLR